MSFLKQVYLTYLLPYRTLTRVCFADNVIIYQRLAAKSLNRQYEVNVSTETIYGARLCTSKDREGYHS